MSLECLVVRRHLILALAIPAAAGLVAGCNDNKKTTTQPTSTPVTSASASPTPGPSDTTPDTAAPSPAPSSGGTLFTDPLDDDTNHWGEDPPSVQFQDGQLVVSAAPGKSNQGAPDVLNSRVGEFRNITVSVDVTVQDQHGQAGPTCETNLQAGTGYIFFLRDDGGAVISRYHHNGSDNVEDTLSGPPTAASAYRAGDTNTVTGTCTRTADGHEHLVLAVNGQQVVSADDPASPPEPGLPGVAFEAAPNPPNDGNFVVAFDNMSVTAAG